MNRNDQIDELVQCLSLVQTVVYGLLYLLHQKGTDESVAQAEFAAIDVMTRMDAAVKIVAG